MAIRTALASTGTAALSRAERQTRTSASAATPNQPPKRPVNPTDSTGLIAAILLRRPRKLANTGEVRRIWRAQMAGRNRDDCHGAAGHIEELHTVTDFHNARHLMTLDDRAHVARAQPVGGQVDGENCVVVEFQIGHCSLRIHCNQTRVLRAKIDLPNRAK